MPPILYFVIPCYNEEIVLPMTAPLFFNKLSQLMQRQKISPDSRVMFVDDGSQDSTWRLIQQLAAEDDHYTGISLSRNRGHQNALLCGLMEARTRCDITISVDCDGQDDIEAVDQMVDEYLSGAEIVYGVRNNRDTDTFFKRFTAERFYQFLNWMGAEVVYNHADYRLVSSRVLDSFSDFQEVNLYLRGMFPLVGFKSTCVYYARHERLAGESHYPLKKMLAFAIDGITSLSTKPIRLITASGGILMIFSLIALLLTAMRNVTGHAVDGWHVLAYLLCLIGGLQLFCLGVVGTYVGKIYMETKARPRYIVRERTGSMARNQEDESS